jgi:hypothetical protein
MEKKINLIGQVEPSVIEAWKSKHGKVFAIVVDGHIGYLRKPTRTEVAYSSTIAQTNPMKSNEALLNSTWLGGSEEIKTNDELFFGAASKLGEIISVKEAELLNL